MDIESARIAVAVIVLVGSACFLDWFGTAVYPRLVGKNVVIRFPNRWNG